MALEISAARFKQDSSRNLPPINNIEPSSLRVSIDSETKEWSIAEGFIFSNGCGISPLKSPHAQSAGTIKVEICPGNALAFCQASLPRSQRSSTELDLPTQSETDLARLSKSEVSGALYFK